MSIYAVNGKAPIAAWIPSLDTAGNGTTTLTDLVGSNNGTLTNMDAATDWVADTGAGGVRALDFDGTNDEVRTTFQVGTITKISMSGWIKPALVGISDGIAGWWTGSNGFFVQSNNGAPASQLLFLAGGGASLGRTSTGTLVVDTWLHFLQVYDGTEAGNASRLRVWINGAQETLSFIDPIPASLPLGSQDFYIGEIASLSRNWQGRLDDIRIFDQALDAADVTALYASGNGRGITFGGTTIQTRRRRDLGGFGL